MKNKRNDKSALKNLALISQIGISMIAPILLGLWIGGKIDKWLSTSSIFSIIFMLLGVGGAFMNLFKITGAFKDKRK